MRAAPAPVLNLHHAWLPRLSVAAGLVLLLTLALDLRADDHAAFVRVSPRDTRYFELSDGTPYIPIGLNMIRPPSDDLAGMETWLRKLAANGGNYARIWLSSPFFDVEHGQSGHFDAERAKRIDALLALARKYDIRLKFCTEHFRHLGEGKQPWTAKPQHLLANGGPARIRPISSKGKPAGASTRRSSPGMRNATATSR